MPLFIHPLLIKTHWGESSRNHPCPLKPIQKLGEGFEAQIFLKPSELVKSRSKIKAKARAGVRAKARAKAGATAKTSAAGAKDAAEAGAKASTGARARAGAKVQPLKSGSRDENTHK